MICQPAAGTHKRKRGQSLRDSCLGFPWLQDDGLIRLRKDAQRNQQQTSQRPERLHGAAARAPEHKRSTVAQAQNQANAGSLFGSGGGLYERWFRQDALGHPGLRAEEL